MRPSVHNAPARTEWASALAGARSTARSSSTRASAVRPPRSSSFPKVVCAEADQGADVLFAMIDGGRDGAIRACRERGVAQIGNVFDWTAREPDVFIASAIADSGHCIELAVADFLAGKFAAASKKVIGLEATEHVRLALHPKVSASARATVEQFRARLIDGSLTPAHEYNGSELSL